MIILRKILMIICTLISTISYTKLSSDSVNTGKEMLGDATINSVDGDIEMSKAYEEFNKVTNNLSLLPINFVYDGVYYSGLSPLKFRRLEKKIKKEDNVLKVDFRLEKDDTLQIIVNMVFYNDYDAWEYTVHFNNPSSSKKSKVLEKVNAASMSFAGDNPVLKGILGDHQNQYEPYEYDLKTQKVNFTSTLGRATHVYFPYFNLEHDNGGVLIAIGWGGTWQADFIYDQNSKSTQFIGTATLGLKTYLKPKENVRTPLIAIVNYYDRDESKAMNKWRQWVIEHNLPRDNASTDEPVKPALGVSLAYDTGRPNSDGSISEGNDSWQRSLDTFYNNGLKADYRWVDAGWYFSPKKTTVVSDWWGTVGTWDLDTIKWPEGSFKESVDYASKHGTKTLLWFEPERVTHINDLVRNYGYKYEWALAENGNNNTYVNNLGNQDCLEWTLNSIIRTMELNGISLYREDFNLDPAPFWSIGDGYQGKNRRGITENLYMQGHYALFDRIIDYCAQNGKSTFIDSCASGGGRNDLETIRRSVPLLRSDSDRTTIELRLAMTTRLVRWLPYTSTASKESVEQLTTGVMDIYVLRASMLPFFRYGASFYFEQDTIDWETLRQGQREWEMMKDYFYSDFYVLTPYRSTTDSTVWTVFEYFDSNKNSGIIQAFRGATSQDRNYTISVKGVEADKYYTLTDLDGINSYNKVKGSMLIKGLPLVADKPRTAMTIYITPYNS